MPIIILSVAMYELSLKSILKGKLQMRVGKKTRYKYGMGSFHKIAVYCTTYP